MTPQTTVPIRPPVAETIAQAGAALKSGFLVGLPTETVYGLAGDATSDRAVAAIFAAKGRPSFNPLIIHLADAAEAAAYAVVSPLAARLMAAFWPGPLTLVLPRRPAGGISLLASAGLDTVALRCPAHPVARAVIRAAGRPLAAPSANPSGKLSPTSARDVADSFPADALALVIDGGTAPVGVESTIVGLFAAGATMLRPGGLPRAAIEAIAGPLRAAGDDAQAPQSPGRLLSHYAPGLPVRLDAATVAPDEALLAFGPALEGAKATLNLSAAGDLAEAAANLFAMLRQLDGSGARAIAVMPVPGDGLGEAIRDRLARAAAPRGVG
ncbi:L-threonylcarbamoyladenylate synthase [Zavarzinia compransoris]|uniref:Threonylcarbamoyl-AMP synthase n=1 Tax=Zavarzinia compransoris TaxID=1264899 RepID=A0A317EAX1_9PROT|nr:L-threonylcarbamoyladenylate synthase [Zavarzinia compransoris]PWR22443.1 threonylcarbamoyl-AMP synthase [Zavarzinia compransoris]TDP47016.1 translation factor SUA5 [Zavarzinia compransoris]